MLNLFFSVLNILKFACVMGVHFANMQFPIIIITTLSVINSRSKVPLPLDPDLRAPCNDITGGVAGAYFMRLQ